MELVVGSVEQDKFLKSLFFKFFTIIKIILLNLSGSYSNRRKYRRKGNRKRVKGRKRQKYRQQEQPAYEDYSTGYGEEYESFDDDVS